MRDHKKTSVVILAFLISFLPMIFFINGCDDSGVLNTKTTDSNVVIYKDLIVTLWFHGTADTSFQAVDLWGGMVNRGISSDKDIFLISLNSDTINFYFRSGDLSLDATGKQTRFNRVYDNLDSTYKFDSLSVIPNSTNELDSLDFTQDDTQPWGYFVVGQTMHPVFSFYLKGKYLAGLTSGYRVYGVFYIKNIVALPNYPLNGVQITIDVKLNTKGNNHFVK